MGEVIAAVDLDLATRLEGEDGEYSATLSEAWELWGPSGGYIASIALRAAGLIAEIKRPASFYCHFLSAPRFGTVELHAECLKRGRRSEAFRVRMTQDGKPIMDAMVRTVADAEGVAHQTLAAPEVPRPEDVEEFSWLKPGTEQQVYNFWNNIERRPVDGGWTGEPSEPLTREWTRMRPRACFDDPFLDAARSLILLDTYGYPAANRMYPRDSFVSPNLDTSAWFHASSRQDEWLLIDEICQQAADGMLAVSGNVWSTDGRLIASGAAQLCQLPGRA